MGVETAFAAVGSFVTAGVASGVAATIIGGAFIGAAIGGLTAAITGGDIGKGLLFGAIGGAVVSGIAGVAAGSSSTIAGLSESTSSSVIGGGTSTTFGEVAGESAGGIWSASPAISSETVGGSLGAAGSSVGTGTTSATLLENVGAKVGVEALSGGIKAYIGSQAGSDTEKIKSEENATYLQAMREKNQAAMDQLQFQYANSTATDKLTLEARKAELDQRKYEFDQQMAFSKEQYQATEQAKADRQALFKDVSRQGGTVDSQNTTGIFDYLQTKPVATPTSALTNPNEQQQTA